MNELFYSSNTFPQLKKIHPIRKNIILEVHNIIPKNDWVDWPEKELYDIENTEWKIFPLYAFGIWVEDNCKMMPFLTKFIKSIPNVKLVILSKLSAGVKLKPHQGWGTYSNNVLRCHYGLIMDENKCHISVSDENRKQYQYHKNDHWIIFDDSKTHWTENTSENDRIILIIDIDRPSHIKPGTAEKGDTNELVEIINFFKTKNIKI